MFTPDLKIRSLNIGVTPEEEEMFNFLRDYLDEGNEFHIGFVPDELGENYGDVVKKLFFRYMLILKHEAQLKVN